MINAGNLQRRARFEQKVSTGGLMSAGQSNWVPVVTMAVDFQPVRPSHADRMDDTLAITRNPARVQAYWRPGITPDMRMVLLGRGGGEADRIMKIVSGPAELGFKEGMELMVEDFSTQGQPA